jgi:hypothetical protein
MENNIETMHNQVIEKASKAYTETEELAKNVIDNANNLQIMPINSYVLVKPYSVNPYAKIKVSEGGLAMNTTEHKIFNTDKGEEETPDVWERVGTVIEVSPTCKFIKEGDDIFYRKMQAIPVNFFDLGFEVVSENQILVAINEGLKERFKNE